MSGDDTTQTAVDPRRSWVATLLGWWILRRLPAAPRGGAAALVVGLCLLWTCGWVGFDWWDRQPDPQFNPAGIPLLAWYAVALVLLACVLRVLCSPRPSLAATLVLAVGVVPLPLVLAAVGTDRLEGPAFWLAAAATAAYVFCYLACGLGSITRLAQRRAAFVGVLVIAGVVWLSDRLDAIPDVWSTPAGDAALSDEAVAENESVLFEQAGKIDAALESVQRGATTKAQAFFAGFAGIGDEKVFAQEIGLASRVLGERYGMNDNVVSLINDERDLDSAPIASVSGLRYLLRSLAARMKVDRDVLFLSLSSHGGAAPLLAVANSQLPLGDLTDDDLAEALHESGIQWRVIIISACYAGGFIDALRGPRTIVITAAAADRTSFGCSSDSDLTYFGAAFYRDALPTAHSLREAFETAKTAIAAREKSEGETPSNPQAWFGAEMEAKLAALERP